MPNYRELNIVGTTAALGGGRQAHARVRAFFALQPFAIAALGFRESSSRDETRPRPSVLLLLLLLLLPVSQSFASSSASLCPQTHSGHSTSGAIVVVGRVGREHTNLKVVTTDRSSE